MKIFIVVDMEGATGVVHPDQLMPEGRGYSAAQAALTADVNAVIEGCIQARPDATFSFRVGDGHGVMRNVLLDKLHPSAELVVGTATPENKPLCQCEGIDDSFDLAVLVGFHTKARTPGGLLAHTFVGSTIADLRLYGESCGEAQIDAAILGDFDVPVGLIVGNSDLEAEIREWNRTVPFVATKKTLGPTAAICYPPARTREEIVNACSLMLDMYDRSEFEVAHPVAMPYIELETYRAETAARIAQVGDFQLLNDRTVVVTDPSVASAFRRLWSSLAIALYEAPSWLR